ncbi:histidine kinase, variant 2 [Balamuthia mandrillaris]
MLCFPFALTKKRQQEWGDGDEGRLLPTSSPSSSSRQHKDEAEEDSEDCFEEGEEVEDLLEEEDSEEERLQPQQLQEQQEEQSTLLRTELKEHEDMDHLLEPFLREDAEHCDPALSTFLGAVSLSHLLLFALAIVASLSFGWAPITVELSAPCSSSSSSSSHGCATTTTATVNGSGNPNLFAIQRPSSAALLHLASFFRSFATQRFASSSFFQFMQSYAYFQPPLSSGAVSASSSLPASSSSSSSVAQLLLDELNDSNRNYELLAFGGMCSFLVGSFLGLTASLITLSPFKQQLFRAISLVNIIAALTYLSIYLRLSPILLDNVGRPLLIGHHLQWCCTTPILLVLMGKVVLLPIRRRVEVVCWDLVMLVSGLLGAVMPVQAQDGEGLGWGIGMLVVSFVAFGFVLRDIWVLFGRSTRLNASSPQGVSLLRFLTICLWSGFPVVVMLGSLEVLSADGVFMWLTVCDVTAKLLFAVALLHLNLLNVETKQVVQRGKRLTLYETALQTVRSVEEDNAILERGKIQAEAVAQLHRTFLANMSHELRTPLNSVIGFNELLLETKLAKRQRTWVNAAFTSAEALLGVIDNILEFSKFETDRIQLENAPFELAHTLRDLSSIVSPFATKKGIRFSISCPPGFPTLLGDAFRLRQILINLVNNATKFAEKGGEVTLHISHLKSQPIPNSSTTTTSPAFLHTLKFHVRDTGIGIPVSKMHFLCKPFSQVQQSNTRRFGGSGLGLVIAQKLAFAMGGSMWVNSVQSKGTIFSFTGCFQSSEEFGTLHQRSTATNDELPFKDTEMESVMQQPENEKEKENEEEKAARKQRKRALRRKSLKGLRVLLLVESGVVSRWLQALLRTWGAKSSAVISFFEGGKPSKLRWLSSPSASTSSPSTSSSASQPTSSSFPSSFSSLLNKHPTPTTTRRSMNEEERREDEEYDVVIMDHTLFSYYLFNADKNVEELLSRFSKARFFSIMQLLDKLEFQEKYLFPSATRPRSSSLSASTVPSFMQQQEKGDNENVQIVTNSKEGGNKRRRRRQKKRALSTIGEENETEESKEKEERQLLMYKTKVVEFCGMKPVRETFLYETLRKEWEAKEQRRGSNDVAEDGTHQHRRRTSSTREEQTPPKTISEQKGLQQQEREQKQQNAASKQREHTKNEQKTDAQQRLPKRSHNRDDGKTLEKTNRLKLQKGSSRRGKQSKGSGRKGKQSKAEESDEEEESEELPEYELDDDEDRYNAAQEEGEDDEDDEDETYDEEAEDETIISKLTDIEMRISQQQTTSSIERHHHLMLPLNPTSGIVTGRRKLIGLVVEDNPLNQKVVSAILRKLGVVFDIACNGIEALVRLTTAKVIYDVIFMDVQVGFFFSLFLFLSFILNITFNKN